MISHFRFGRAGLAVLLIGALGLTVACAQSMGQATLIPPTKVAERDTIKLGELSTDRFGNLYAAGIYAFPGHLLRFKPDLTPVFDRKITEDGPIATDSAGRVFVGEFSGLRQYTSNGTQLGEWKTSNGSKGGMSSDSTGHLYVPEFKGGKPFLNEYALVSGTPTVVASTPYVGTPTSGSIPVNFFDTAVDGEGDVYASGRTQAPETRFIHRYGPDLTGPPFTVKSCSTGSGCGTVYGLDVPRLKTLSGPSDFLIATNQSLNIQVYSTAPSGTPVGSFPVELAAGSPLASPIDFASSDCTGSLYVLLNVFGGPNGTFSGSRIQRYTTGAATGPCPSPPLVSLKGGLGKQQYKLVPNPGADEPCIPCVVLSRSGAEVEPRPARNEAAGWRANRRPHRSKGLKLRFKAAAAADVRFLFRGPTEGKGKPKPRGGFLYAASAGTNKITFTGVLKNGKPLRPGTYKTTVTDAERARVESFKTKILKR